MNDDPKSAIRRAMEQDLTTFAQVITGDRRVRVLFEREPTANERALRELARRSERKGMPIPIGR